MNKSYVLRAGRYTTAQKNAYESLYSQYIIPYSHEYLDLTKIFLNNKVSMEIGFGMGTATAQIACDNPDMNYIGIEVHRPGIGRLLWEIEKRSLLNIRIIEYDAVIVTEKMIPPESLDAIHIFFPDPWPKKRHKKRRLIQRPFTDTLAKCLKPDGYLYMVTDWEDYALQALDELTLTAGLENAYEGFAPAQSWRPSTKFEKKGIAKEHDIKELYFKSAGK
ncbi:MAG: tRNA (guanosine(46)-N7)-methyltransferase TrmB [Treponema sp.]|nr:tRNA (guanosine(46)-N7)-methyltransferase TrmB [Treponema sp.]